MVHTYYAWYKCKDIFSEQHINKIIYKIKHICEFKKLNKVIYVFKIKVKLLILATYNETPYHDHHLCLHQFVICKTL